MDSLLFLIKSTTIASVHEVNSKDNKLFKMKTKSKTKLAVLTGLACFLYKNTNMFTFSVLRSGLLL